MKQDLVYSAEEKFPNLSSSPTSPSELVMLAESSDDGSASAYERLIATFKEASPRTQARKYEQVLEANGDLVQALKGKHCETEILQREIQKLKSKEVPTGKKGSGRVGIAE